MSVSRAASSKVTVAYMSYAHHDDSDGQLSKFRERLVVELRQQTGVDVEIFMDNDSIQIGEHWRTRLDEGLAESTFLLPITPSFLMSSYCREELQTFRRHERALGRADLILPVSYIDCDHFRGAAPDEPAAATLGSGVRAPALRLAHAPIDVAREPAGEGRADRARDADPQGDGRAAAGVAARRGR
jgi:hypothetical protein